MILIHHVQDFRTRKKKSPSERAELGCGCTLQFGFSFLFGPLGLSLSLSWLSLAFSIPPNSPDEKPRPYMHSPMCWRFSTISFIHPNSILHSRRMDRPGPQPQTPPPFLMCMYIII